jgi:hypothetical protein
MLQHPKNSNTLPAGPARRSASKLWFLLLVLPYLGLLWPALYARAEPQLFGFPFFYWYQFAWVILSAALTGIVYLATGRR